MGKPQNKNSLSQDVEALAEQCTVAEAESNIWKKFDNALSTLDTASRDILQSFFDGKSAQRIAEERGLEITQVEEWIRNSKNKLVNQLRVGTKVRQ